MLSVIVAAGGAAFAYSKLGRRVGYGNSQGVWKIVGVIFVIGLLFMYSLLRFVIHWH